MEEKYSPCLQMFWVHFHKVSIAKIIEGEEEVVMVEAEEEKKDKENLMEEEVVSKCDCLFIYEIWNLNLIRDQKYKPIVLGSLSWP